MLTIIIHAHSFYGVTGFSGGSIVFFTYEAF